MISFADQRALRLTRQAIKTLDVNLDGYTVLTEVGSGMYKYTPIIASMCGARRVVACTRDSRYAKGSENIDHCSALAKSTGIGNITFYNGTIPTEEIREADIITNSGFLRPLDKNFLSHVDPKRTVIPLMFEAWEIRKSDIDIDYCAKNGIRVAGTWENYPSIKVFDSVGTLAVKMAFEAGYEVHGNNIVVWGDEHFGKQALEGFLKVGASTVELVNNIDRLKDLLPSADFIYICDYNADQPYFATGGLFEQLETTMAENLTGVVHLYGDVDAEYLASRRINVYPRFNGRSKLMTFTLGHVGLRPIINLQTAGFKVAQEMLTGNLSPLSQPVTY